jgi:hypothetical protein
MTSVPAIDLTRISPVTDAEAARLASPAAFADVAGQITAQSLAGPPTAHPSHVRPGQAGPGHAHPGHPHPGHPRPAALRRGRRWSRRGALLAGLPLAVLAGAAALFVTLLVPNGGNSDNGASTQVAVEALSFTKADGFITVIIRNPFADVTTYNADFARHHIDINLTLTPVSPSLVGKILKADTPQVTYISTPGTGARNCNPKNPIIACTIGFKVPVNFHGHARVQVGRPGRPGEVYALSASAFAPGDILYPLRDQVFDHPLSQVLPVLARNHISIANCRKDMLVVCRTADGKINNPAKVGGGDYVQDGYAYAAGQVVLYVGIKTLFPFAELNVPNPAPSPTGPAPSVTPTPAKSS